MCENNIISTLAFEGKAQDRWKLACESNMWRTWLGLSLVWVIGHMTSLPGSISTLCLQYTRNYMLHELQSMKSMYSLLSKQNYVFLDLGGHRSYEVIRLHNVKSLYTFINTLAFERKVQDPSNFVHGEDL